MYITYIDIWGSDNDGRLVGKLNYINPLTPNHSIDAIVDIDGDDRGYIIATVSVIVIDVVDGGGDDDNNKDDGKLVAAWGAYVTQQINKYAHTHSLCYTKIHICA